MDRGQVMRAVGWALGVPAALAGAAFLAVLLVNWNDEPPSADALRLMAMKQERPAVDDAANGYIHVLGLAAAPDLDPLALGRARNDYIEGFSPPPAGEDTGALPGRDQDYWAMRGPEVAALAKACTEPVDCLAALEAGPEAWDAWIELERWLLDRYQRMLAAEGWREAIPGHVETPFPAWQHAIEAQKLHLLTAYGKARTGDAAAVRDLLERDHAFWRRALASSETLITKMVAVVAVRRNLGFGNLALRELPPGLADEAMPPGWRQPVTVPERSLARALRGEWEFMASAMRTAFSAETLPADASLPVPDALAHRLFQKQATANLWAARMVRLGEVSELPYPELAAELDRLAQPVEGRRLFRLYNPIGHILDSIAAPAHGDYIARVADLEGQRSATVLVADLRDAGTPEDAVADAILGLPADGAAANGTIEWDADVRAVLVHGLAAGDRGRFVVPF